MLSKRTFIIIGGSLAGFLLIGGIVYLRYRASEGLDLATGTIATKSPATSQPKNTSSTQEQPQAPDQDQDGLSDNAEIMLGTDPAKWDTDSDSVSDGDEVNRTRTDPKKSDQNTVAPKPRRPAPATQTSSTQQTSTTPPTSTPATPPVSVDPDRDGLTDAEESRYGADQNNPDTDGDGLTDGDEVYKYKTDPKLKDTDGDGYTDGSEVQKGYNPRGAGKCLNAACTP